MQFHYKVQWHLLRPIVRSYFRLSAQGCEHIPPSGPLLLAANHCSYLDPPLIALGLPRQITFLAKAELFSVPIFSQLIRWNGAFPVARGQGDMKALRQALRLLQEEKALLVFPEGTRSPDGRLQPLESGVSWLAIKSGAPVVPLYIGGTYEAFSREAKWPRPSKVHITVGPLLHPAEFVNRGGGREQIAEFNRCLANSLSELQKCALESDLGKA